MTIKKSPSMRREWIEMLHGNQSLTHSRRSPSMRREWIEMRLGKRNALPVRVSLHAEGVD